MAMAMVTTTVWKKAERAPIARTGSGHRPWRQVAFNIVNIFVKTLLQIPDWYKWNSRGHVAPSQARLLETGGK